MAPTHIHSVQVEFGDCDPAQIAYFPNFFRWFDAATFHFFRQCGLPAWHELEKAHGVIGFPVVDVSCQFRRPARVGDRLEVRTTLEEWRDKSFVIRHQLLRGEELLAEAREIRVFAMRDAADATKIKAVPAPEKIRSMTS